MKLLKNRAVIESIRRASELLRQLCRSVRARQFWAGLLTNNTGNMDIELPDNLCESCGYPMPRLVFDEVHKLLLCGRYLGKRPFQEDRSELPKSETF